MDVEGTIEAGGQALERAREATLRLPSTHAFLGGVAALDDAVARIRDVLASGKGAKGIDDVSGRLAACLLLLAAADRPRFASLTEGATNDGHRWPYPSVRGLTHLAEVLHLLGGAHDLCLLPGPDGPALAPRGRRTVPPTNAAEVLAVVEPLVSGGMAEIPS